NRQCTVSLGHSGSPIHGKSRRSVSNHRCLDDQCSPSSTTCQCPSVPALSAHPCHLPLPISAISMPHISAHLS
ncbi:unnamed protein product, partial [Staurois parvus]